MTNATVKKLPFGSAPKVDNVTLPAVRTIADDNKLGAAIGSIGGGAGGIQRLMCSTAFYLGSVAKKADEDKYDGETYWTGFYGSHYAAKPLSDGSQRQAKSNALVYVKVAMLPYDTRELAEEMFDHPHGSMNQKATALRSLIKDHGEEAPSAKEWKALLPAAPVETVTTIVDRATDVHKTLENIYKRRDRDDAKLLWAAVSSDADLQKAYNRAVNAALEFLQAAEAVTKAKSGKAKGKAAPAKGKTAETSAAVH